jgi:serine phosphatase RsbU (regulator of sigma subunit)/DNA-binding LacI/PurR family transcriptional regulator
VWNGIKKVARERNVNIIAFAGGSLEYSDNDQYQPQRNILYKIPTATKIDGIIICGSLCSYVSKDRINKFIDDYGDVPIVSMLPLLPKIPAVTIDNRHGMKELVLHLVEEHRFKKFAFINGPLNNPEVKDRFSVFIEILKAYGIEIAKEDIFTGNFDRESGINAVKKIAEKYKRKIPYEVIVCIDDETAFGAMETLKEMGFSVPQDVAVVGFDNTGESKYTSPPLTSVDQPLRKLGEEALLMLLEKLDGKDIPERIMLRTKLVKRHSCGCFFDYDIPKGRIRKALIAPVTTKDFLSKEDLYFKVLELFNNTHDIDDYDKNQLNLLTDYFCEDVNSQENEKFLKCIRREFQGVVMKGNGLSKLSQFYRILWYYSISHLTREAFAFADMLINRANSLRFDMLSQYAGFKQIKTQRNYDDLYELKRIMSNAGDYDKILSIIAKEFPQIGFNTFFMLRYKSSPTNKFVTPKLVLAVKNGKKLLLNYQDDKKIYSNEILPQIILETAEKPFVLVTEPLYFRNETFGVLYFLLDENNEHDNNMFEILGGQISDALHTEQLMSRQKKEIEKEHSELVNVKHELELGSDIQRSFLPQEIYQPNGYNIEVTYQPAREVSGDFYDIYKLSDDKMVVLIADVSGKDVSSALFMALTKTLLQVLTDSSFKNDSSPLDSISATNDYIAKYNQLHNGRFMFVTLLFGILNLQTGVFEYVNAGHNPGFLFSAKGTLREELKSIGPAIGLAEKAKFPVQSCIIEENEFLFLYTDGVTDTQNSKKKFYSLKRLLEKLSERKYKDSQDLITSIDEDLSNFRKSNDRFDDITMISIFRTE